MKVIWKFRLKHTPQQAIEMPQGAELLTIQTQDQMYHLWALVIPENQPVQRLIRMIGTGHPIPIDTMVYIETLQDGPLVWHFFEEII